MKRGSRDEQKDIGTVFGTCNADRFCAAFSDAHSTPMYTEAMQKLMASTTDDYATEQVWNLDEDTHKYPCKCKLGSSRRCCPNLKTENGSLLQKPW